MDAESNCKRRDHRSTRRGVTRCASIEKITISSEASKNPSSGDITMNATTLISPLDTSEPAPGHDLEAQLEAELAGFTALLEQQRTDPSAPPAPNGLEATR